MYYAILQPELLSVWSVWSQPFESGPSDPASQAQVSVAPPPPPPPSDMIVDIGVLLENHLPQSVKLEIINLVPDANYTYPVKNMYGINRRFKVEWAKNYPWGHYSMSKDGVYCKACALFAPCDIGRQKLGVFVTKPFQVWTKQSSAFLCHEEHKYHQDSLTKMVAFRDSCSVLLLACWIRSVRN